MAVTINGNTIKMTRGDTLKIYVLPKTADGEIYAPEPGDRIRFAMKESYEDDSPLILKEIPIDTLILTLNPEDTKDLPMPSSYVYDVELTYANGDVDTFIDKAKLILKEEVH